jgi:ATP-dependent DNA ligase
MRRFRCSTKPASFNPLRIARGPERAPDPQDSVDAHDQRHCEPRCYARFASGRRWRAILVDALRLATYSAAMPLPRGFVPPCLPTKAPQPPSGDTWVHEIKHDGFRVIGRKDGERVRLYSRPRQRPDLPLPR